MKYAWIEAQAGWQPIVRLYKVLGVSRSGFLQWRKRGPSGRELANRSLDAQVAVIHAVGKQGYGRIRVTRRLRQSGMRIGAESAQKPVAAMARPSETDAGVVWGQSRDVTPR